MYACVAYPDFALHAQVFLSVCGTCVRVWDMCECGAHPDFALDLRVLGHEVERPAQSGGRRLGARAEEILHQLVGPGTNKAVFTLGTRRGLFDVGVKIFAPNGGIFDVRPGNDRASANVKTT